MGERKVIQKYYPADFDPRYIPRGKKTRFDQVKVRMMLPMSVRCLTCGNFLYKGTKFNSRKEPVRRERYLGIKVLRFYMKCTRCSAELTIKTDPKNDDYVADKGCVRTYEPWRQHMKSVKEDDEEQARLEEEDSMKLLENKTKDSKREMEIVRNLDELKSMKAINSSISVESLLQGRSDGSSQMVEEEEEEEEEEIDEEELERRGVEYAEKMVKKQDDEIRRVSEDEHQKQLLSMYNIKLKTDMEKKKKNDLAGKKRKRGQNVVLDEFIAIQPKKKKRKKKSGKKKKKKKKKRKKKKAPPSGPSLVNY